MKPQEDLKGKGNMQLILLSATKVYPTSCTGSVGCKGDCLENECTCNNELSDLNSVLMGVPWYKQQDEKMIGRDSRHKLI